MDKKENLKFGSGLWVSMMLKMKEFQSRSEKQDACEEPVSFVVAA